jgi:hypothetical protein
MPISGRSQFSKSQMAFRKRELPTRPMVRSLSRCPVQSVGDGNEPWEPRSARRKRRFGRGAFSECFNCISRIASVVSIVSKGGRAVTGGFST